LVGVRVTTALRSTGLARVRELALVRQDEL
jgi:hypothetical protein